MFTIALRARSPDLYQASLRAKRSNPGKRSRNRVRDDRFLCILPATCHRERRSLSAIYRLLRRVAPRNDGKCAALSLAALNNFVCKANETYVHSVRAMPQAAQQSFACFSLCLLLQLRALLETCKMASLFHSVVNGSFSLLGCSRITSSRALPYGNALHSTLTIRFLLRNQKEKMNNNLHNLCMCSIDVHDMNYVKII